MEVKRKQTWDKNYNILKSEILELIRSRRYEAEGRNILEKLKKLKVCPCFSHACLHMIWYMSTQDMVHVYVCYKCLLDQSCLRERHQWYIFTHGCTIYAMQATLSLLTRPYRQQSLCSQLSVFSGTLHHRARSLCSC